MRLQLITAVLVFILPACMAPVPAPTLDLKYAPTGQAAPASNITLTLLKPHYMNVPPATNDLEKEVSPVDTIPALYAAKQAPLLQEAIEADLGKIFIAKGFLVSKASGSSDNLAQTEKQKTGLVAVPIFDLRPLVDNNQTVYHYPGGSMKVVNTGTVQLAGSLFIEFIEPITQRKLLTKKVEVTSLSANVPMEYEAEAEAETNFLLLLNKVYPRLLKKLEESIHPDELRAAISQR